MFVYAVLTLVEFGGGGGIYDWYFGVLLLAARQIMAARQCMGCFVGACLIIWLWMFLFLQICVLLYYDIA